MPPLGGSKNDAESVYKALIKAPMRSAWTGRIEKKTEWIQKHMKQRCSKNLMLILGMSLPLHYHEFFFIEYKRSNALKKQGVISNLLFWFPEAPELNSFTFVPKGKKIGDLRDCKRPWNDREGYSANARRKEWGKAHRCASVWETAGL